MFKSQRGFSLIEVVVVLAIVLVASSIAMPSIISWRDNMRMRSATSDLLIAFKKIRSEAVKRNTPCTIVFNQPVGGQTFDYVLFVDANDNRTLDAGEEIIDRVNFPRDVRVMPALTTFTTVAGRTVAGYNARGLVQGNWGRVVIGLVVDGTTIRQRAIAMTSLAGAVRIAEL